MTDLDKIIERQREYFYGGFTKTEDFRRKKLERLRDLIDLCEENILHALDMDLGKANFEAYVSEISFAKEEIKFAIDNLSDWMKPVREKTPLTAMPAKSYSLYEPLGVTLIIAPWNYPFLLAIDPLIGAIASGNTVILKTSSKTKETSRLIRSMINDYFEEEFIYVVDNDEVSHEELLEGKYDHIFYTGGKSVGKHIMKKASENLTKVTLELGGKSPCIVDRTADLDNAARSIMWGKTLNAGQTCVAPDYILVDLAVKEKFIGKLKEGMIDFYGLDPLASKDYGRIINEDHLDRLLGLIEGEDIIAGGIYDRENLKLMPTIVDGVDFDSKLMEDEIFGPIIPILTYDDINPILYKIKTMPKPLAFYLFSEDERLIEKIMYNMEFGNGCVNDCIIEIASPYLEFGGVGESGMGGYHGYNSFVNFSNKKSIMETPSSMKPNIKYPPYEDGKLNFVKKVL
ncbi:MAG: aldehyde dehydrogenase family protein [Anaerococcus sp.]|uniref:aldehyde dehydrogenase family protein n=1 Tax=Anaerococcus sp. TaxID=1872515 RepID=UPI0026269F6E|nr:aldehyde dehydrogenase family protein [Anaerococcus sp.]MCI5972101.1 aldehyde dehydrogenase family protein [Anaerococcus sp.]